MDTLSEEIQSLLMDIFNDANVTLKMMVQVNKHWHYLVSRYASENHIKREISCNDIAKAGYLVIVKWAHTNGYRWSEAACPFAALGGIVKY
jgi:hypothetical protein